MNKYKFKIEGMTCEGCVSTIKTKLELEDNISEAIVSLEDGGLVVVSIKDYEIAELNKILSPVGDYIVSKNSTKGKNIIISYFSTYKPILITLGLVLLLSVISFNNSENTINGFMRFFMGFFFIIFSFLKLQNIKQFALSFSNYDPITKKFFRFGIMYPFIELILGVFFLTGSFLLFSNAATLFILIPQTFGIFNKLRNNQNVNCACLGTSFNIPLSNLTIIENLSMCLMAIYFISIHII